VSKASVLNESVHHVIEISVSDTTLSGDSTYQGKNGNNRGTSKDSVEIRYSSASPDSGFGTYKPA